MSPLKLNGSTSGFVALDAPAAAGSNTLVLPTGNGSNGQVLTTNGSGSLSWSTITTSKILQVVNATYGTETTSTTGTFVDTGLTATITPTSSSSKILVLVNQTGLVKGSSNTWVELKLLRGSTDLIKFESAAGQDNATGTNGVGGASASYLDSPNTTSATTYKTQFRSGNNSSTAYICYGNNGAASVATITLMEVAA